MKKQLLIRYFNRHDSQIPFDSVDLGEFTGDGRDKVTMELYAIRETIVDWLHENPNGKVDFITVNAE